MSQPLEYERQYDFTDYQTANPTAPLPGDQLDAELNAVKQTLDGTLTNLALIQKDDGDLANDSVGIDQLKAEVAFGFNSVRDWAPGLTFVPNDGAWEDGVLYRCLVGHVSTVFATDLAASKWSVQVDMAGAVDDRITEVVQPIVDTATAAATTATTQAGIATAKAVLTAADAVATAADRVQTGADRTQTGLDRTAAASSAATAAALVNSVAFKDVVFKSFADSPVTLTAADAGKLYVFDTSGGACAVTMPAIAGNTPMAFGFQKITTDANALTLTRASTDTFGAAATTKVLPYVQACACYADTDPSPDRWTVTDFGAPPTVDGVTLEVSGQAIQVKALGVDTAQLKANAVTNAKMAQMVQRTIKARKTASTGDPEDCTLSELLDFITSAAQGDILFRGATVWERLAAGTAGYLLKTGGAGVDPSWSAVKLGAVASQSAPTAGTSYQWTGGDGFLHVTISDASNTTSVTVFEARSDAASTPTTVKACGYLYGHSNANYTNGEKITLSFPIRNNDYYRIVETTAAGSALAETITMQFTPLTGFVQ